MLFAIFLVKCARQCQDSKRFMLSFAWQYQNSQAFERNHYSRTFLVIALVKQKISSRLKCWSSLFADILLHYRAHSSGSSRAEMFWSLNVMTLHSRCSAGSNAKAKASKPSMPKNNTLTFSISYKSLELQKRRRKNGLRTETL